MVAPMLGDEDAVGAIVVSGPRGDAFDALDLGVLEVVAAHTAVACRNVRLYASMREAAEIAEAMLELGAALAAQVSVGAVAGMLARAVDRLVECAGLSVWLRADDRMELAAHVGYTPREVGRLEAASLARRRGAVHRQPRRAPRARAGRRRLRGALGERGPPDLRRVLHPRSDRRARGQPRGARRPARPPSRPAELARRADAARDRRPGAACDRQPRARRRARGVVPGDDAVARERARDEGRVHGRPRAGARRDGRGGGAGGLELGDIALRDVGVAAALHDVGKIGIPASILDKPGPLTDDEWEVMRRHPELGARIMEPVPALAGARSIVLACHEHWDGSGYPRGLAGDDIPLGAQDHPRLRRVPRDDIRPRVPPGDARRCRDHRATATAQAAISSPASSTRWSRSSRTAHTRHSSGYSLRILSAHTIRRDRSATVAATAFFPARCSSRTPRARLQFVQT